MARYDVEIGASNVVHHAAGNLYQVKDILESAQGTVSVADLDKMEEIFCGTADQARRWIELELELR